MAGEVFGVGARVVVSDINVGNGEETVGQISAQGDTAMFVKTNIANEASVAALVEQTVSAYGKLPNGFCRMHLRSSPVIRWAWTAAGRLSEPSDQAARGRCTCARLRPVAPSCAHLHPFSPSERPQFQTCRSMSPPTLADARP
ncbi:SDR family NAD(P)-dependent oxidoreductase [Paraburkholderia xenovorans]|uniref:SDR family NAD(P)-dependent oxidoreductase n=1 Tax=Paraburkholderia xenovorans TaxID=36873 RepID=UPI0038B7FB77